MSDSKIKIGFIAPLTGPFPEWGKSLREGLSVALEDTRHKFEVDYQDDECISKYFRNRGTYTGISGKMTFEKDGRVTRPYVVKKIENGKFAWVEKAI